jgi:hypothetical protein
MDEVRAMDTPITAIIAPTQANGVFEGLTMAVASDARPTNNNTNATTDNDRQSDTVGGNKEPAYLLLSAANAVQTLAFRFKLGLIKNSFFAMDKTMYYPESMYLTLTLDGAPALYFTCTNDASLPALGAATATLAATIEGLTLQMCNEENILIQNKLRSEVAGAGLKILIDTVESQVSNITGTNQSLQSKYSSVFGGKLRKWFWAPYSNAESLNTYWDHSSIQGNHLKKITTFYALLNNNRLNTNTFTESTGDSYFQTRDKLVGSCINSQNQAYQNFLYQLDFTTNADLNNVAISPPQCNFNTGLDLSDGEKRIDINMVTSGTLQHYTFGIIQREMILSEKGIFVI